MNTTDNNLTFISKQNEAGNATTYIFKNNGQSWTAGQYRKYTLPQAGSSEEENSRYFTIASAPNEENIYISTRVSDSSFKQCLDALTPGESIQAENTEGDFLWDDATEKPLVFVAAGIGITPFRSMLLDRAANRKPLDVTLLYFNRNDDIPFLETFQKLANDHDEFTFTPIVGEHVTTENILERAPQSKEGTVYIAGPEPMVESIGETLKEQGITLKQDWFPGYTSENF